jgi:hypothetical protein
MSRKSPPAPAPGATAPTLTEGIIESTAETRPDDAAPGVQIDGQGLDPAAESSPEQTAPPEEPADLVECAVLYDSVYGKHDDIIQLPRAQADAAHAAGFVDTHPHAMKAIRAAKGAKANA